LAEEQGGPVYLPYTAMGERSIDFSHHMSDTLVEKLKQAQVTQEGKSTFNDLMKNASVKDAGPVEDWPGLGSKNLRDYLVNASGVVRNKFAKLMDTAQMQKHGFPSVAEARHAVIDPRLLNAPTGSAGLSIARATPEVGPTGAAHRTYSTGLGGEYIGGFGQNVPREIMYPDIVKSYTEQGYAPFRHDYLMMRGAAPVYQRANQQWLDNIMTYLRGRGGF
jgi:hypothetical protein